MSLNLHQLEAKLDAALAKETRESLNKFLGNKDVWPCPLCIIGHMELVGYTDDTYDHTVYECTNCGHGITLPD